MPSRSVSPPPVSESGLTTSWMVSSPVVLAGAEGLERIRKARTAKRLVKELV
jgi:hypothetical protein